MSWYKIRCKQCLEFFETNNKHRRRCLKCKEEFPTQISGSGELPFVRKWGTTEKRNEAINKIFKEVKEK